MKLHEYASFDGIVAELVAKRQVTAKELARTAAEAIGAGNPAMAPLSKPIRIASRGSMSKSLARVPFAVFRFS
jgi:hypothetical protein